MKVSVIVFFAFISAYSFAQPPGSGQSEVTFGDGTLFMTISGDSAEAFYDQLDVPVKSSGEGGYSVLVKNGVNSSCGKTLVQTPHGEEHSVECRFAYGVKGDALKDPTSLHRK